MVCTKLKKKIQNLRRKISLNVVRIERKQQHCILTIWSKQYQNKKPHTYENFILIYLFCSLIHFLLSQTYALYILVSSLTSNVKENKIG